MDPISDMLIRIKNAQAVGKETVAFPHSKIKMEIAKILQAEGFVKEAVRRGKKTKKTIELELVYDEGERGRITDVKRISKLSKRVYKPASLLRPIKQGGGIAVISTSKGLMTDKDARRQKVGGEVLFEIW